MSQIKDLEANEIQQLKDLSNSYNSLCVSIGHTHIQLSELEKQVSKLNEEKAFLIKDYDKIIEKQEGLQNILLNKYGEGKIDIETGKIELF